ncbi:group II intron reverse transcriptase/maturase [Streptomyces sp. NPDC001142]
MFLREKLKLELSESKTLITHAASQAASFLGYAIRAQRSDTKISRGRRATNGVIGLYVPQRVIRQRCAIYMRRGRPASRGALIHDSDYSIVVKYQAEYRGVVQYYLLAQDVHRLGRLRWVMETSMLRTLANKHRASVRKMARKLYATTETPDGPRWCLQVTVPRDNGRKPLVATFGGIPLKRKRTAEMADRAPATNRSRGNELLQRLLVGECEMCGSKSNLHVHHIRKMADLKRPGRPDRPSWVVLMARKKRKTLIVCETCHQDIHAGRATSSTRRRPLESDVR